MPRTFISPNGFPILVGKNKHDNDQLTFEIGKPYDFWFHADQIAGSHVVLQWIPTHNEPKIEDFECAANYAAYFSKARGSTHYVPVHLCRVCDVEKTKGSPPGRVQCNAYYSIQGKPFAIKSA